MGAIADTIRTLADPTHGIGRLTERWAAVFEPYGDYYVSTDGRVYSDKSGKMLKQYTNESGLYPVVSLYHEGEKYQRLVHYLVVECLRLDGPVPSGSVIHHKDEDEGNASLDNLEVMDEQKHLELHGEAVEDIPDEEKPDEDRDSFYSQIGEDTEAPF